MYFSSLHTSLPHLPRFLQPNNTMPWTVKQFRTCKWEQTGGHHLPSHARSIHFVQRTQKQQEMVLQMAMAPPNATAHTWQHYFIHIKFLTLPIPAATAYKAGRWGEGVFKGLQTLPTPSPEERQTTWIHAAYKFHGGRYSPYTGGPATTSTKQALVCTVPLT